MSHNDIKHNNTIMWAHGWGQDHNSFNAFIPSFTANHNNIALDMPGFGKAAPPPNHWGTADYADAIADWIKGKNFPPIDWVGHSFGCRVGIQLAARHPEHIKSLCLVAGAGLKRKRPTHKKIYFTARIKLFKLLKRGLPDGSFKQNIMKKFGSADYTNAGEMRSIFVRVVNEDLTEQAKKITCPTTLIYGMNDTETPPEFGKRLHDLIPNAKLFLLDNQDHYSVLNEGRHQVIKHIKETVEG